MTGLPGGPPHLSGVDRHDSRADEDAPAVQQQDEATYPDGYADEPQYDGTYTYAPAPAYEPGDPYERDERTFHALVIGGVLLMLFVVSIAFGFTAITDVSEDEDVDRAKAQAQHDRPPYYTVRRGDTYSSIAQRHGLTVEDLETFNPRVDPAGLVPGQRLKLVANPPKPKPKPLGPRFVTVRSGDTFSSIGAKYDHSVDRLRRLNPKLKPETLRPGDRLRLR